MAVVDKDIILESELVQYVQYNIGSQAALDSLSPAQLDTIKRQVLDELIKQKVLLAKARADTLAVDTREVDKELDARIKTLVDQAGGQQRLEEYYGMPLIETQAPVPPARRRGHADRQGAAGEDAQRAGGADRGAALLGNLQGFDSAAARRRAPRAHAS